MFRYGPQSYHVARGVPSVSCVVPLQVGEAGPILDMMASALTKLSGNAVIAKTTMEAMCVLAQTLAFLPDQSYSHQVLYLAALETWGAFRVDGGVELGEGEGRLDAEELHFLSSRHVDM